MKTTIAGKALASLMTGIARAALGTLVAAIGMGAQSTLPDLFPFPDGTGLVPNHNSAGPIPLTGAFFQSLGTNGSSCGGNRRSEFHHV